jgi:lipopolysaccharide/colanic/teichoic acid biosynthesis glycosyltransferase
MPETLIKEPETRSSVTVSNGIYAKYIKRIMDFFLSLCAVAVLSPILIILTVIGAIVMEGNPFFVQERPGKNEKIFKLIKFRTMTCEKDSDGKLLPDEERLTKYGNFIRHTSLDELPELFNILKGDMAVIGPRPLLVKYLPLYNEVQRHRHDVRPGLTGNAQAHGRNGLDWDKKFKLDIEYVENISFLGDVKIILDTVYCVIAGKGISQEGQATMEDFEDYINSKKIYN